MHNSLFIRDRLKQTNADPLRLERRDPHRLVAPDPAASAADGEFALTGGWQLSAEGLDPEVGRLLVDDLADFFQRMGVQTGEGGAGQVQFALTADLGPRDCRLRCQPDQIIVEGGGVAGLWAGITWLEWEMRCRRGAILSVGEIERRAAWPVQISQGPWGGNYSVPDFSPEYLSDDAFRLYAHYGVNSMMIYGDLLCYVQSDIFPELNTPDYAHNMAMLRDAAQRAARYGVQFSYVVVGPKLRRDHPLFQRLPEVRGSGFDRGTGRLHFLCSSHELCLDFYRETFTRLFSQVPQLAGLILIVAEESFYHCHMWRGHAQEMCPRCGQKTNVEVLTNLLGVIDSAAKAGQPDAWVATWVYNTQPFAGGALDEFIRRLPPNVIVDHQIEKNHVLPKYGYRKHIWDYSIDFTGPSDELRHIAATVRDSGHRQFIKSETGIGLETFQFPYVPAMQRLAEKWQHVRDVRPAGVQQSWLFFGMFGSRAEELGLWAAYAPEMSRDAFLRRIASRDFGPRAADTVVASWESMSRAMGHLPCICLQTYYIGPSYLGPAHPLVPAKGATVPDVFDAYLFYLQEGEETFSRKQIEEARTSLVMADLPATARSVAMEWDDPSDGWDIVIREYAIASAEAEDAWKKLRLAATLGETESDQARLREELLLSELVYRTMVSCENTVRFLQARRDWEERGEQAARAEMERVARWERQNALDAVHIYQEAPWLDIAERTDGIYNPCAEMIAAKVAWIDEFLAG